jgi:hypothetical protein
LPLLCPDGLLLGHALFLAPRLFDECVEEELEDLELHDKKDQHYHICDKFHQLQNTKVMVIEEKGLLEYDLLGVNMPIVVLGGAANEVASGG